MTNALVWVLLLTTMLLFAAAMTAAGARSPVRWRRGILHALSWVLSTLMLVGALVMVGMAAYFVGAYRPYFYGVLALAVAFAGGVLAIRWYGRRRPDREGAADWPASRLLIGALVSATLLIMTIWNMDLQTQLQLQGYRAQAATLLLSTAPPPIPDRINAARVYERAFAMIEADAALKTSEVFHMQGDPQSEEVRQVIERHAQTLELIRTAADTPECRFDYDYSYPSIELFLPDLGTARQAANLLALAARSEAAAGNTEAAIDDVGRLYSLSGHVADNPMLVSHLVSMAINAVAHERLAEMLPRVRETQQLEGLMLPSAGTNLRRGQRALLSERAFGVATICDLAAGRLPAGIVGIFGDGSRHMGKGLVLARMFVFQDDIEGYQEYVTKAAGLLNKPYYEAAADRESMATIREPGKAPGIFTSILAPALQGYLVTVTQAQAHDTAANVAVAFTKYRLANGRYPQTLEEAGPTLIAVDPFDGKPIRIRATDEGLIIYSVGKDLSDDGGIIDPMSRKGPADVGVILRTRPASTLPAE